MSQLLFKIQGCSNRNRYHFVFPRLLLACCLFASVAGSSAIAAESPPSNSPVAGSSESSDKLSAIQLTAILKENEQKSGSKASRVIGSGPRVTVMAQPSAQGTTDREMKIDAVFFAKTLIENAPHQIEKIDVIFSGAHPDDSKVIAIDKKAIQTYGEGNMSPEDFLKTLHLMPVNAEEPPALEPGPMLQRRLLISERIEKLRKSGTGVKPFQTIFQSIESAIKGGDTTKLAANLQDLEDKLTEQEEQLAIAKRSASGLRLTPVPGKSTPGSSSPVTTNEGNWRLEFLKKKFNENSAFVVQRAQSTNNGSRLSDLKRRIDDLLARGKNNDAFPLLEEFMKVEGETIKAENLKRQNEFPKGRFAGGGGKFENGKEHFGGMNRGGQW